MKFPTTLKIGGNKYRLLLVSPERLSDDTAGETDTEKLTIKLSTSHVNAAYLPTLLHEILHAINGEYKEKEVEALAQALYQVFKDNPKLTKLFLS